jgi:hypothetical protein
MNARASMLGPHAARRHNYFGNAKGGVRYEQTAPPRFSKTTQAHPTLRPPFNDLEVADRMVMVETEAMQRPK